MTEEHKCSNCNHPLSYEVVTEAAQEHNFTFALTAQEGSMFQAKTVGGTLASMADIFEAGAEAQGVKHRLLVNSVECNGGTIKFHLVSAVVI